MKNCQQGKAFRLHSDFNSDSLNSLSLKRIFHPFLYNINGWFKFADKTQTSVRYMYSTLTEFKNLLSWSTSTWYFFSQESWSGFYISPLHTSPNCPAPSFLLNSSDSLGISQASLFRLMTGLDLGQGLVNCRHNPSDWPVKTQILLLICSYPYYLQIMIIWNNLKKIFLIIMIHVLCTARRVNFVPIIILYSKWIFKTRSLWANAH